MRSCSLPSVIPENPLKAGGARSPTGGVYFSTLREGTEGGEGWCALPRKEPGVLPHSRPSLESPAKPLSPEQPCSTLAALRCVDFDSPNSSSIIRGLSEMIKLDAGWGILGAEVQACGSCQDREILLWTHRGALPGEGPASTPSRNGALGL